MEIEIPFTIPVIIFSFIFKCPRNLYNQIFQKYYQAQKYANLIDKYFDKNRYQGLTYFNPYQYVNSLLLEKSHILT